MIPCDRCGREVMSAYNPLGDLVLCEQCYKVPVAKYVKKHGKRSLVLADFKKIFGTKDRVKENKKGTRQKKLF